MEVRNERSSIGQQRSYAWEFKLQVVQLLEKGEHNPSQISRDYHVNHSLFYVYSHVLPSMQRDAMEKMGDFFRQQFPVIV